MHQPPRRAPRSDLATAASGTQLKQPLQVLKRPLDHLVSAAARPPWIAVPLQQRPEDFLLHPRMPASILPTARQIVLKPDADIDLDFRLCGTAEQRDTSGVDVSLQACHCVFPRAVGVRKEQPEVEESVAVGKFLTNGPQRVRIAAEARLGQHFYPGLGFPRALHQLPGQGLQDVPVPSRIFRDDEYAEAHSAASSQPSESSSETGFLFTTSKKSGTSASARIRDSPVSSSRLQTNVVR